MSQTIDALLVYVSVPRVWVACFNRFDGAWISNKAEESGVGKRARDTSTKSQLSRTFSQCLPIFSIFSRFCWHVDFRCFNDFTWTPRIGWRVEIWFDCSKPEGSVKGLRHYTLNSVEEEINFLFRCIWWPKKFSERNKLFMNFDDEKLLFLFNNADPYICTRLTVGFQFFVIL